VRFTNQLRVWLPGQPVLREPTFWESIASAFGSQATLQTAEVQTFRNALSLCEGLGQCLSAAGITNAISLTLDDRVLFHDGQRYPNDLPSLVHAARLHAPQAAAGFKLLRAVFEHEESDVHVIVEGTFRSRFPPHEPAAILAFGARLAQVRALPGEEPHETRARVEAFLNDANKLKTVRAHFDWIVNRVRDGVVHGFPEARVDAPESVAQVVRPSRDTVRRLGGRAAASGGSSYAQASWQRRAQPGIAPMMAVPRYYDPWVIWYDDPWYTRGEMLLLDSLVTHAAYAHAMAGLHAGTVVHVVHENGAPICEADAIGQAAPAFAGLHELATTDFDKLEADKFKVAALTEYGAYDPGPPAVEKPSSDGSWWSSPTSDASSDGAWKSSDCKSDCASTDCASSDCSDWKSSDCKSDCASSDCSDWKSSDCKSDCSSDCASSDCASSDCASSDCASSDCSSDCSSW
jgi:hypothetical protein